jgi:hypothetical protein
LAAPSFHAGEAVDIEAYVRAYPDFSDSLRRLLPALQVLADIGRSAAGKRCRRCAPGPYSNR